MNPRNISRLTLLAGTAVSAHGAATAKPTAGHIVEIIRAAVGVTWRQQTVDRIIAGDADTPVSGTATTMMATFDVLNSPHIRCASPKDRYAG